MNPIIRPATLRDLPQGLRCIRDLFLHDTARQAQLLALWTERLMAGSELTVVVVDADAPPESALLVFAIGEFLAPRFVEELRANAEGIPLIERVFRWRAEGRQPFLSEAELRAANTQRDLPPTLVCTTLHSGALPSLMFSDEGRALRNLTAEFNYFALSGYRLAEYFTETYGEWASPMMANFGFSRVHAFPLSATPPDAQNEWKGGGSKGHLGHMWSITEEEAMRNEGMAMAPLFLYEPPVFGLNTGEREMLRFALAGLTDGEIADLLSLAVVTVRKRWMSVYEKVGLAMPELLPGRAGASPEGVRGAEKKRRLLSYLKTHLAGLRPYSAAR